MDKTKFRLTAGILLSLSLLNTCRSQQNTIFNQSPFQRRQQQTQQLRQQLQQQQQQQQQQAFPNAFTGSLNPLTPLNTISPISPIIPQGAFRSYNQLNSQNFVPITAYQNELNYDGSFAYGYSAGDGTTAQAQGYVKNLGLGEALEAQVVQGSYSYTSPEGTPITVRYIADENGFRAEGAHIPTPPPIPDAIAKSLQYIGSVPPYQQSLNPNLNPYQTPYRQYPTSPTLRPGQQLTPLQLQQQQQRIFQQQSGQYQPDNQYNTPQQQQQQSGQFGGGQFGAFGYGSTLSQQQNLQQKQQSQQNFTQQQQNLQQQQLAQQQQQQQQQQQKQQQQQNSEQQQQLVTQELRGRPSQLVNPFGYSQYRRYKKATKK